MFGLGMSYADIAGHVEQMYGIGVSKATISTITDRLIAEVKAWQARPLDNLYPFMWLDAIHYKIRDKGRYRSKTVYTVLALNMDGKKEVLGLYLSESEGANFWLSVLTDLQNRGVEDILIAVGGRLDGFPGGHCLDLSGHRSSALHRAPDPQLTALRRLKKSEGVHGRSETRLPCHVAGRS